MLRETEKYLYLKFQISRRVTLLLLNHQFYLYEWDVRLGGLIIEGRKKYRAGRRLMAFFNRVPPFLHPPISPSILLCIAADPLSRFLLIDFRPPSHVWHGISSSVSQSAPRSHDVFQSLWDRSISTFSFQRGTGVKALATTNIVCWKIYICPTRIPRLTRESDKL